MGYSERVYDTVIRSANSDDPGIRRDSKKSRMLINSLWDRWVKQFFPSLSKRSKWTKDTNTAIVGNVIVVVADQAPKYI